MWLILKNKSNELNLALSELAKINLRDHYIAKTKINKKLKNVPVATAYILPKGKNINAVIKLSIVSKKLNCIFY